MEKVSSSDIFLKLAHELVPVSSTRTNQLKLSDGDFDKMKLLLVVYFSWLGIVLL